MRPLHRAVVLVTLISGLSAGPAYSALRIVSYNLDADTDRNNDGTIDASDGVPNAALGGVLQAIGSYRLGGRSQAIDVLAVQELNYNSSVTLQAVVNTLNGIYGAGTYAYDPLVGGTTGNLVGNGPNGLIYNTKTVRVLSAVNVGDASGGGAPRTPIRYQLRAIQETGANTFYLYNSHAKAGGAAMDLYRRGVEAGNIRSDQNTLARTFNAANPRGLGPATIYAGDFNTTAASNDPMYTGLTTTTTGFDTSGQAVDPVTSSFANSSSLTANERLYTQNNQNLTSRLDYQLVTANVLSSDFNAGLKLVDSTYTAFGNSYYVGNTLTNSVDVNDSIATSANAAATGLSLSVLQGLTAVSDHLPIVADYVVVVPEPGSLAVIGLVVGFGLRRRRGTVL